MKLHILAAAALAAGVILPAVASAGGVEKTDGFVCPVFNADSAVAVSNPNVVIIGGGDATIVGPSVSVPTGATNGDGAGTPGGSHSSPGDSDYTAVWAG